MSSRTYLPWDHSQTYLLPPSLMEWLPGDHLAYFVLELVQELDVREILSADEGKDARGQKAYAPMMMVAVLVYGYCTGVFSSRRLEQATYVDVAFRVLCANQQPHFTTINEFRRLHRKALAGLFVQVLKLCQRAGLVKLGQVAVDGTKMQANASKHKAMSYVRMQAEEKRLQEEVERLLANADDVDAQEDALYGVGQRSLELPEELKRRETRLKKIRQAKAALEQEAREQRANELRKQAKVRQAAAETLSKERAAKGQATGAKRAHAKARELDGRDETPARAADELQGRTMEVHTDGTPKDTSQRNFTDPESSIMPGRHGFIQAYNCQVAVDAAHQIIVAADVTNQSVDNAHLSPIAEQIRNNTSRLPEVLLADTGYWNPQVVEQVSALGVDVFVALQRDKHSARPEPRSTGAPPPGLNGRETMRWRLNTAEGRAHYARRKAVVEPVFGQIRVGQRFNRLSFRGLSATSSEWKLVAACHNLLKLFRLAPAMVT
jgi:transposase